MNSTASTIAIGDRFASWHCDNIYTVIAIDPDSGKIGLHRTVAGSENGPTVRWDWHITYWSPAPTSHRHGETAPTASPTLKVKDSQGFACTERNPQCERTRS